MSEFGSGGFERLPSLHIDNKRVGEFSEWTIDRLEELVNKYGQFLSKPQMPRATETANRILDHLLFELAHRDGIYDEITGKDKDELCQNT